MYYQLLSSLVQRSVLIEHVKSQSTLSALVDRSVQPFRRASARIVAAGSLANTASHPSRR